MGRFRGRRVEPAISAAAHAHTIALSTRSD
jgi:hypothetical protein